MRRLILFKQVIQHLQALNVKADMEEPSSVGFDMNMEYSLISIKIIVDEQEQRVMLFGEGTFTVPPVKFPEVMDKINQIHQHSYSSAYLFVNTENGHLMSQAIINADSGHKIDFDVFRYALCDVAYSLDGNYREIMSLLVAEDPVRISIGMPKKNRLIR